MGIEDIKIFPQKDGNVLAAVCFRIGGFAVHDCLLIQKRDGGRIVVMPRNRKQQDIVHPLDKPTREKITKAISDEYDRRVKEAEENA